jgi:hypothetical protein
MKKFWEFLNGKKTVIGAIASTLIGFAQARGYIEADVSMMFLTVSGLIIGVGTAHKIAKVNTEK